MHEQNIFLPTQKLLNTSWNYELLHAEFIHSRGSVPFYIQSLRAMFNKTKLSIYLMRPTHSLVPLFMHSINICICDV